MYFATVPDDIGLRSMTFRTSKEAPSGNQAPKGAYAVVLRRPNVNRVAPIDPMMS